MNQHEEGDQPAALQQLQLVFPFLLDWQQGVKVRDCFMHQAATLWLQKAAECTPMHDSLFVQWGASCSLQA
jgi:hypothetical protein